MFWRSWSPLFLTYLVSCRSEIPCQYLVSWCSDIPCQLIFLPYFRCQILFWLSPVSCGSELPGQLLFWRDWSAAVLTYNDTLFLTYLVSCCSDVQWHLVYDVPGQLLFWRTMTPCFDVPGLLLFWRTLTPCFDVPGLLLFWRTLTPCFDVPGQLLFWRTLTHLFWRTWSAVVLTYLVCCCSDVHWHLVLTYLVSCCSDVHWHLVLTLPGQLLFWRTLTPCFDVPGQLLFWRNLQIDGSAEAVGKLIVFLPVNIVPKSWREHLVLNAEKTPIEEEKSPGWSLF